MVALIACVVLVFGARRIGLGAWDALMDRAVDPALLSEVERVVKGHPGVLGFHDLKSRSAGSRISSRCIWSSTAPRR